MKRIKDFIKNYIRREFDKLIKEVYLDKIDLIKKLQEELNQYSKYECSVCRKEGVAHYGGFYRDFKGRVFCSHECIKNKPKD